MSAILSRLSILFINNISRDLDNIKILLYKLFVRYLVVKLACLNAAYWQDVKNFVEQISIKLGGFYLIKMNLVQTVL